MDNNAEKEAQGGKSDILNEKVDLGENTATEQEDHDGPGTAGRVEQQRVRDELAESKDKYLRLYAEFENFRRRTAKERLELMQTANEELVVSLIPISDDFERAERALTENNDAGLEGFSLIHNKFKKVLEQYGVRPMEVKIGADFNADLHEAINQIPAPEPKLKGKIIDVVEKGYLLGDKVVRFAKVVVGS